MAAHKAMMVRGACVCGGGSVAHSWRRWRTGTAAVRSVHMEIVRQADRPALPHGPPCARPAQQFLAKSTPRAASSMCPWPWRAACSALPHGPQCAPPAQEFLIEIHATRSVDFASMAVTLVYKATSPDEFTRMTAIKWLKVGGGGRRRWCAAVVWAQLWRLVPSCHPVSVAT